MKRRAALQHILIGTTGIMLFPACDFESEIIYDNIIIEKDQRSLLKELTDSLLPTSESGFSFAEDTQHFILNNINQLFAKADIEKYMTGLSKVQGYIKEVYRGKYNKLSNEEKMSFFQHMNSSDAAEEMRYFVNSTKQLVTKQFTTSEKYMTEQLDYEMVPSRFLGCKEI